MEKLRHNTALLRVIGFLLVMAVLLSGFLSVHVHIHHHEDLNASQHTHDIDMHVNIGQSEHDNHIQILDINTQGMTKKFNQINLSLALMLLVIILLPISRYRIVSRLQFINCHFWQYSFHLTPQLRAPPQQI